MSADVLISDDFGLMFPMKIESDGFEVKDQPQVLRWILAGSTLLMGVCVTYAALWNLKVCVIPCVSDEIFFGVGVSFFPVRNARLVARADIRGIKFTTSFPVKEDAQYEFASWQTIQSITITDRGEEGYFLELRVLQGRVYQIPTFGFKKRAKIILAEILLFSPSLNTPVGMVSTPQNNSDARQEKPSAS